MAVFVTYSVHIALQDTTPCATLIYPPHVPEAIQKLSKTCASSWQQTMHAIKIADHIQANLCNCLEEHSTVLEIRIRNWSAVFKDRIFYRLLHCCPIKNVWEIWPIKMDFGWLNAKIGRKMANGPLLFLALLKCIRAFGISQNQNRQLSHYLYLKIQ